MQDIYHIAFESVEWVWAWWLFGVTTSILLVRAMCRGPRRSWRQLHRSEDGASYTLSYFLCIPLLAFLICITVDMTLMLVAKTGTVYAAYAAARSSVVWHPSGVPKTTADEKMKSAAVQAMTPFASSSKSHRPLSAPPPSGLEYYAAHQRFAENPASFEYIGWKWQYANWATSATSDAGADYKKNVTVTLDYKAPFHVPGIGRLLGTRSPYGFYHRNIRTTVTLESQAPQSEVLNPPNRPLGISYVPAE